jgi:SOS response regulatory protein OraA/RecX
MRTALIKLWSQKKESDDIQKWIKRMIGRGYGYGLVKKVSEESAED